jgi:hypothetical protein
MSEPTYAPGDIIKVTRTVKVHTYQNDPSGYLVTHDVQSGDSYRVDARGGSLKIELVCKAAKTRPQVGDVLTGKQIRETQWKRGTYLVSPLENVTDGYALQPNGKWRSTKYGMEIEFSSFYDGDQLRLVHLP